MAKESKPFVFKRFQLHHGNGSWKVGTDSVLLGSWCRVEGAKAALDMGAGSGILSLMLAQRNEDMRIDAVEISPEAIVEARMNIQNSSWSNRIRILERDVTVYDEESISNYDVIVCNPPYYPSGIVSPNELRMRSRQGNGFSIWEVPRLASAYLNPSGRLNVVLPEKDTFRFIAAANATGLYVQRSLTIKHDPHTTGTLSLLELSTGIVKVENLSLVLYAKDKPTADYISLCQDFIAF